MGPKQKQKMSIGDFLSDQSLGSWADEMEGQPTAPSYSGRSTYGGGSSSGFGMGSDSYGAGRSGGFGGDRPFREALPLPTRPPFTAHLGNLSFDVTERDLEEFLSDCEVSSIRIIEDKIERKPKGFAYVEFKTLDGLKKALELSETQFQGRNVRISVADGQKGGDSGREISDWTRKGPLPDLPGQRGASDRMGGGGSGVGGGFERGAAFERAGGFERGRNFEAAPEMGQERGGRRPMFENDAKPRDFGNWERKGPLEPAADARPQRSPRDFGAAREERTSPAPREDAGSRPPREARPAPERVPTAADNDSQWRARMRPDAPSPAVTEPSTPSSPTTATAPVPAAAQAPAQRPKLNLQKRTVSEAPSSEASTPNDAKASPFGAARPIDSRAREAAVEEKRQLSLRQKKEADDKTREEKKTREAAKQAERDSAKDSATATPRDHGRGSKAPSTATSRKNSEANTSAVSNSKQYEILRRMEDSVNEDESGHDGARADANGQILGDKETKPQEIVVEVGKGDSEPSTATALEDDGFQVVEKKNKGRGGSRALAS